MTSPSDLDKEPLHVSYPSAERFEEILAEAEMNCQTPFNQEFLQRVRAEYEELGMDAELNSTSRLRLRQLSTGAIR